MLCECKAHDSAVEKTYACSYVTVIKDIQDKNKDWKIIPVFTARDGFQKGAKKILRYYRIIYLEMKDCRNITYTLTEETTIRSPILENMEGTLEDGTPVDNSAWFRNYSRGYNCGFQSIIRSFEVLDQNGKKIDNLNDYLGEFHTGKRVVQYDIDDEFLEEHSGKKLVGIKGTVTDHTTTKLGKTETKIKSSVVTRIKLGDGSVYRFDLDGSCYKMNDSDTDTTS